MIRADRLASVSRWKSKPLTEKAVLALGLLAVAVTMPPLPAGLLALATAWVLAWRSGVAWREWLALLAVPAGFIATGAAALSLTLGESGIGLAADGGRQGLAVAVRALASVSALLLLAVTTPTPALLDGLRRLGLPAELAEVALSIYRFIFILADTAAAMHTSQAARLGTDGWRRSVRSAGLLAAALLPRALDRAQRQEIGLAARGFDGSLRTLRRTDPVSSAGLARAGAIIAAILAAGWAW